MVLKPGGYQTSFYMLGWTPGTLDFAQRDVRHHGLPRRSEERAWRNQSRRLLQQGVRCRHRQGAAGDRYRQTRSIDQGRI